MKDLIERLACDCDAEVCVFREAAAALSSQAARIEELEALLRIEREDRKDKAQF